MNTHRDPRRLKLLAERPSWPQWLTIIVVTLLILSLPTARPAAEGYTKQEDEPTVIVRLSKEAYQRIADLETLHVIDYDAFVWMELTPVTFEKLRGRGVPFQRRPDAAVLKLQEHRFDTRSVPSVSAQATSAYETGTAGLYVVQLRGPSKDAWQDDLRKNGMDVLQYVHSHGYIVRMTPGQAASLDELPFVRWVGPYLPEYRLPSDLLERSGIIENVSVTVYDDGQTPGTVERTVQEIESLGGTLVNHYRLRPADPLARAIFTLPASSLTSVSQLRDVVSLNYRVPAWFLEDEMSGQIAAGNYDPLEPGYREWLSSTEVSGAGVTVALMDTGYDTGDDATAHPDVSGRLVPVHTVLGAPVDDSGHGTHVGGIIAGDATLGITDTASFLMGLGVAPEVTLVARDTSGDQQDIQRDAVLNGAVASNNSYGLQNASSGYTDVDSEVDGLVRDANPDTDTIAEPLIVVFSAGNCGNGPAGHPCYNNTGPTKEAKNVIAVGASRIPRDSDGNVLTSTSVITEVPGFSSQGPAGDGRIYPHVAAPGEWIISTRSSQPGLTHCVPIAAGAPITSPTYSVCRGTSMAAPHVTGGVALMTEWWRGFNAGADPSPAMAKALLVNGAVDMGTPDIPNGDEGWGRIHLHNVISPSLPVVYHDQTTVLTDTGELWLGSYLVVDPSQPVKVTLTWSDAPGPTTGGDPEALINDLNLSVITSDASIFRGNNFVDGFSEPGGSHDDIDNLENVFIENPSEGRFNVLVIGEAINGDGVPYNGDVTDQDFALVVRNAVPVNADVMLIIDSSGSMSWNDPDDKRLDAARAYVAASYLSDYVGVVDFDYSARLASPPLRVMDDRSTILDAIDTIDSSGGTDIGVGVQAACDALLASTSDNTNKAAILLTDGQGSFSGQDECFSSRDWPIYTFGFGSADEDLLQQIATNTGGEYRRLPTSDLVCEFMAVRAKIAGLEPPPCPTVPIYPGATVFLTATVPSGTAQATFATSWAGSDVVMSLTTPSGRVIERETVAPDVIHDLGATFETYTVLNPEAGVWTISLYGADVPAEGEAVVFSYIALPGGGGPPPCGDLYPIALHADTAASAGPGDEVIDILNGAGAGNFGWLSWTGHPSAVTLVESLTPPGDSDSYINPNDGEDQVLSMDDWVYGGPGVTNAAAVRDALDTLMGERIAVPVWDEAAAQGQNLQYHISGFVHVEITGYHLPDQNRISVIYRGPCTR